MISSLNHFTFYILRHMKCIYSCCLNICLVIPAISGSVPVDDSPSYTSQYPTSLPTHFSLGAVYFTLLSHGIG